MESKKFLDSQRLKSNPYKVPEGYFQSLSMRLESIPYQAQKMEEVKEVPTLWTRLSPIFAVAASFVAILAVGTAILKSTAESTQEPEYADLIGYSNLSTMMVDYDEIFQEEQQSLTDEDILDYLITTGITVEHINYDENE